MLNNGVIFYKAAADSPASKNDCNAISRTLFIPHQEGKPDSLPPGYQGVLGLPVSNRQQEGAAQLLKTDQR